MSWGSNDRDAMDIVRFYNGDMPSWGGRYIKDIWNYDDKQLEHIHDYIQWLFPIIEPSYFNRDTPKLSVEVIEEFMGDEELREKLLHSFKIMMDFYGLRIVKFADGTIVIDKADDYEVKSKNWQTGKNHNLLRITRILHCMNTLGRRKWAEGLYTCLKRIEEDNPKTFQIITMEFWHEAMKE